MVLKDNWVTGDEYTPAAANAVATQVNTNTTDIADKQDALPAQTGNSGRVLGTDGSTLSWVEPETGSPGTSTRETFIDCAVWYVDGADGDDDNEGRATDPMLTIDAAITAAGDTAPVLIRVSNITTIVLEDVQRNNRLHIMPADLATPEAVTYVALENCRNIHVRGFDVQQTMILGHAILGSGGTEDRGSVDCVLAGNKVGPYTGAPPDAGIHIKNQSYRCVIANNEVTGIAPATGSVPLKGICTNTTNGGNFAESMGPGQTDIHIIGNYVHGIAGDGIASVGYNGSIRVINNFVTGCFQQPGSDDHPDGIQIAGSPDILIKGNAIWDTEGSGGGIIVKDYYNCQGLRLYDNTVWNIHNITTEVVGDPANGIQIFNAPGVEVVNNICWDTWAQTLPNPSTGGGLSFYTVQTVGSYNGRAPALPDFDIILIRNILDKLNFWPGSDPMPTIAVRDNNWIWDPDGNGNRGYDSDQDMTEGDDFNGISETIVEQLCQMRTVTRLAKEWRRDPFSHWFGIGDVTASASIGTGNSFLEGSGGIAELVEDTTPQLGGDLDLNGNEVGAATAADLTKLHALTADATELNYVDGVTSAIQTQLNAKVNTSGRVDYVTVTTGSEARPSGAGLVFWVGGSTEPTNMGAGDVWLSEA